MALPMEPIFPLEIFHTILGYASNDTLLVTGLVSQRMRCWSADTFIKINDIMKTPASSFFVTLRAAVLRHPAYINALLRAVRKTERAVHLACELFDLIEYNEQVNFVFSSLYRFRAIEIRFNPRETRVLEDARVPHVLASALASAAHAHVTQLDITASWITPPFRRLSTSTLQASRFPLRSHETLMDMMEKVTLSCYFLATPQLSEACRAFMTGPRVQSFCLDGVTNDRLQEFLPFIRLPALTLLQLRSDHDRLHLPSHFFEYHAKLTHLSMLSYSSLTDGGQMVTPSTPVLDTLPPQEFPRLEDLCISSNHYNWTLHPNGPTTLLIQPQDMFPSSDGFCTAIKSISRPLQSVRVNNYSRTLIIRLPNDIERHVRNQPPSLACCGCGEERTPGIRKVELQTENLHVSTLVSVIILPDVV